jgi:transcriptional regulator with XRE-family HTH domain
MKFANWLKEQREMRAMTQQEFAEFVGLSKVSILSYEKGIAYPSVRVIKQIANALNVNVKKITTLIKESKKGE